MTIDVEFSEYTLKSTRLNEFDAGIDAIIQTAIGPGWQFASEEQEIELLTERQRNWRELRGFYEAAIVNSCDLFNYVGMVYDQRDLFAAIGATKTLAAADALLGLYEQQQQLPTQDQKDAFWHQTREGRQPIEDTAENILEFADLLIRYAEQHPMDFPTAPPCNPIENLLEISEILRQRASEAPELESFKKLLDTSAANLEVLRKQLDRRISDEV